MSLAFRVVCLLILGLTLIKPSLSRNQFQRRLIRQK